MAESQSILLTEVKTNNSLTPPHVWDALNTPFEAPNTPFQSGLTSDGQPSSADWRRQALPFKPPPELKTELSVSPTGLWNYGVGAPSTMSVDGTTGSVNQYMGDTPLCAEDNTAGIQNTWYGMDTLFTERGGDSTQPFNYTKTKQECLATNVKSVPDDGWNQRTCFLANQARANQINNTRWQSGWGGDGRGPTPNDQTTGETVISDPNARAKALQPWCSKNDTTITAEEIKEIDKYSNYDLPWVGAEVSSPIQLGYEWWNPIPADPDSEQFMTNVMTVDQPLSYKCYDVFNETGDRNENTNYMPFSTSGITGGVANIDRKGPVKLWFPGAQWKYLDGAGAKEGSGRYLWGTPNKPGAWDEAKNQDPIWDLIQNPKFSSNIKDEDPAKEKTKYIEGNLPGIFSPNSSIIDKNSNQCVQGLGTYDSDTKSGTTNKYANHNYLNAVNSGFYNSIYGGHYGTHDGYPFCRRAMQYYACPWIGRDLKAPKVTAATEEAQSLAPPGQYTNDHQWPEDDFPAGQSYQKLPLGGIDKCGGNDVIETPMRKVGGGYMHNWGQTTRFGTYMNAQARWDNTGSLLRPPSGAATKEDGNPYTYPLLGNDTTKNTKKQTASNRYMTTEMLGQTSSSSYRKTDINFFSQQCAYPPSLIPGSGEKCVSYGCEEKWVGAQEETIRQLNLGAQMGQTSSGTSFLTNPGSPPLGGENYPKLGLIGDVYIKSKSGEEVTATANPITNTGFAATDATDKRLWNGILMDSGDFNWTMAEHCFEDVGEQKCVDNNALPLYANWSPEDSHEKRMECKDGKEPCDCSAPYIPPQPGVEAAEQSNVSKICGSLYKKSIVPGSPTVTEGGTQYGYCPRIMTGEGKICRQWAAGEACAANATATGFVEPVNKIINTNLTAITGSPIDSPLPGSDFNVTYGQGKDARMMADSFMLDYVKKYPESALSDCLGASDENSRFHEVYKFWSGDGESMGIDDENVDCWLSICKNATDDDLGTWGKGRSFKTSGRRKRNQGGSDRYCGATSETVGGIVQKCDPPPCGQVIMDRSGSFIQRDDAFIYINCGGTGDGGGDVPKDGKLYFDCASDPEQEVELTLCECKNASLSEARVAKECSPELATKLCRIADIETTTIDSSECPQEQCCLWDVNQGGQWQCTSICGESPKFPLCPTWDSGQGYRCCDDPQNCPNKFFLDNGQCKKCSNYVYWTWNYSII